MNIESVQKALGEFADDFNFAVEGVFIVARAKAFIPNKDAFKEIARRLKNVGGVWVSNGKLSHWKIPMGTVEANPKLGNVVSKEEWTNLEIGRAVYRQVDEVLKLQVSEIKIRLEAVLKLLSESGYNP